jgi:hypothetical protein
MNQHMRTIVQSQTERMKLYRTIDAVYKGVIFIATQVVL